MTDTALLKSAIDKSGYKLGYIADQMGIARNTLYRKVNGKSDFTAEQMNDICKLLRIQARDRPRIFYPKQ